MTKAIIFFIVLLVLGFVFFEAIGAQNLGTSTSLYFLVIYIEIAILGCLIFYICYLVLLEIRKKNNDKK